MAMTNLQLYNLKRQFGKPLIIRKPSTIGPITDYDTGNTLVTYDETYINRVVFLPPDMIRDKGTSNQAQQSAHRMFSYGGYFDSTSVILIIPSKYQVDTDTRFRTPDDTQHYQLVKIVEKFDNGTVVEVKGVVANEPA